MVPVDQLKSPAIVPVPVTDSRRAGDAAKAAGIKLSVRAGQVRVASYFYNSLDDTERAAEVLKPFRRRSPL